MSSFNPDVYKDGLYFVPLGGSEQFGVNLNVYMSGGKMLAVDCGIGFADERFPGIDLLLPDPEVLEQNREALVGLIITHAHEDHVGAAAHLWRRLKCPIYTTPFTAQVLKRKLEEADLKDVPVHVVDLGGEITLDPFQVKFLTVAHSVPDAAALVIETPEGRVLHSGDWNLDPKPVVGAKTDKAAFQAEGKKGILAYIGDSTNAQVAGKAGSESEVEEGLYHEFKACKGRIAVTTFASNIGRIISIARAAKRLDRSVGVVGRSLHRMIGAAHVCGLMDDLPDFVSEDDLGFLPDDKVVMICTGSQGESRAALARMARADHPSFDFKRGDTVIFSARAIPGNERGINDVKNNLSAAGVRIISPSNTKNIIHVSGHPCRDEIAEMLQWVKPQLVVPVHGERVMLDAHAAFARECQVPHVIVPSNGSVIKLGPGEPKTVDHIPTGVLAVDQKRIVTADHSSISERRKLQYTGTLHVSLALDARGKVLGDPQLDTVGLLDTEDSAELKIEDALYDEILGLMDDMTADELLDDHFVAEELRIGLRRFCFHTLGIKPKASIHVLRV